jgi:hypothetical protein
MSEGEVVVNALLEIISNDPLTAPASEVGRRLARCQRCEHFRDGCCGRRSWSEWLARLTRVA